MAHFKPFARAKAGAPSHRSDRDDSYDDSSYRSYRRHRRYRRRGGLLGDLLGL